MGCVENMAEGHDNDACGKCIWTRVQVAYDTLTAKDRFECNDMNSNRDRLGVRCSCKEAERFCPFAGASFEHVY